MSHARELWKRIETIHAVTYFAPESITAAKEAGLRGFWMGYFGFRAAPMGSVSAGVVHATFANFARSMVDRSIPDAWAFASPTQLIDARAKAAAAALHRVAAAPLTAATDTMLLDALASVVARGEPLGRPLFAANAALGERSNPVEQLWQLCTSLREHRGDGHVIALASHNVTGCEAHWLHAAANGTPHEVLRDNRGFQAAQWAEAGHALSDRRLLEGTTLTPTGHELVANIELLTDQLAAAPIDTSGIDIERVIHDLTPVALEIVASGVLPFPNPMGLPQL